MIRFDELAKDLAGGMKRREAFRRIGGGLAGALLASFGVGRARAQYGFGLHWSEPYCSGDCNKIYRPNLVEAECCQLPAMRGRRGSNVRDFSYTCEGPAELRCEPPRATASAAPRSSCDAVPLCGSSVDCPTGWFCTANSCCSSSGAFLRTAVPPCSVSPIGIYLHSVQGESRRNGIGQVALLGGGKTRWSRDPRGASGGAPSFSIFGALGWCDGWRGHCPSPT